MLNISKGEKLLNQRSDSIVDRGGEQYSYANYWEDLYALLDDDIQRSLLNDIDESKATRYLLSLYRSVINTVIERMKEFKRGQDSEAISGMIDKVEQEVRNLYNNRKDQFKQIDEDDEVGRANRDTYDYILNQIDAARVKLATMQ